MVFLQGGVVLLTVTLFLQIGYNSASKKLSVSIDGTKRLHTLSTFLQALILFPWNLFISFTKEVSFYYLYIDLFIIWQ